MKCSNDSDVMLRMVFFLKGSSGGYTGSVSSVVDAMVDMAVTKGSITTAEKAAIIKPVVVEPIIKEIKTIRQ